MNMNSATPQQPAANDTLTLMAELEKLVENGKHRVFGHAFIDEHAFFIGTAKLKKALPYALREVGRITRDRAKAGLPPDEPGLNVLRLVDELEQLVENGKCHLFGGVFIDEQAYFTLAAKLNKALPRDLENARSMLGQECAAKEQPGAAAEDAVLDAARAEAQRIIEAARREAERIVEEARRHGAADFPPTPFGAADAPFADTPFSETNRPFGGPEGK